MSSENKEKSSKTVLNCESGRMIILENSEAALEGNVALRNMAQAGTEEGYVLYSRMSLCPFGDCDTPGLFLSILTRPKFPLQQAGLLSAAAATAVARAVEKLSEIDVRIRWVNDLMHDGEKLCSMGTSTRLTPEGQFEYAVIGMTVCLSQTHFPPKLGDVVRRVFTGELRDLSCRLAEAIALEFFAIYDHLPSECGFMEEYKARSCIIGKKAKVLVGDTYLRGRVTRIDDGAGLTVTMRSGNEMTVTSRSEILF